MTITKIINSYAASLLSLIRDKQLLSIAVDEVRFVVETLKGSAEFNRVLKSPVIKAEAKAAILTELFQKRLHPELFQYLLFLVKKDRIDVAAEILGRFLALCDEEAGIITVDVTSAIDLAPDQQEQVRKKIAAVEGKTIRMNLSIDPELIGGFIIKAGDRIFDASLQNQLRKVRKQLASTGFSLN